MKSLGYIQCFHTLAIYQPSIIMEITRDPVGCDTKKGRLASQTIVLLSLTRSVRTVQSVDCSPPPPSPQTTWLPVVRFTTNTTAQLEEAVIYKVEQRNTTTVIFLYFIKVFDCLDRNITLHKLNNQKSMEKKACGSITFQQIENKFFNQHMNKLRTSL